MIVSLGRLLSPLFSPALQSLPDLLLEPLVCWMIVSLSLQVLRKIFFFYEVVRVIMGIFVIFSVTHLLHQRSGGIPQLEWNGHVPEFSDIFLNFLKSDIEGIRLGCGG